MLQFTRQTCTNTLLRALPDNDFRAIANCLERVEYAPRDVVFRPNQPTEMTVFPESGIFSVVMHGSEGRTLEIGLFGRDGVSTASAAGGIDSSPLECFIQVAGSGLQIRTADLTALADERPAIRQILIRWIHVFSLQTAQTALANGSYNVEERLARWLLMCQDRLGRSEIQVTHEFLGKMLAVRRASVTLSIHMLEGSRLISARRGNVTILDREALISVTDGCYGPEEVEYERYIGPLRTLNG